jgi:hypothetical protein
MWPGVTDQILWLFDSVSRLAGPTHYGDYQLRPEAVRKLSRNRLHFDNKELSMKLVTNPQSLSSTVEALAWLYATVQCSAEGVAASGVYLEQSGLSFRFASYNLAPFHSTG